MRALEARVEEVARDCNSLAVANLTWAYATMGSKPRERVLGALDTRAVVLSTDFGDDIALTKWAHATIGTGQSNELAFALSVREDALYVGGAYQRGESHSRR